MFEVIKSHVRQRGTRASFHAGAIAPFLIIAAMVFEALGGGKPVAIVSGCCVIALNAVLASRVRMSRRLKLEALAALSVMTVILWLPMK